MEGKQITANKAPVSPLTFLYRTAHVYGERTSIIYGSKSFTWTQTLDRCRRLAAVISSFNVSPGQVVSVVAPNTPAHYEMHFGVPMSGAILNSINIRLDARNVSVILQHAESKLVFVDSEFYPLVYDALQILSQSNDKVPAVILIKDIDSKSQFPDLPEYEQLLANADPSYPLNLPENENDSISLNYTSGTTSNPKGVLYTHRGAYLNSLASAMMWNMEQNPVYLWTLPMFHCNGWCYTWVMAAQAGINVCMRSVTAAATFDLISRYGVGYLCGAPTVLIMIAGAAKHEIKPLSRKVKVVVGGAPPPAPLLSRMEDLGFDVTHSYGLTETYGPATVCVWKSEWNNLPLNERAQLKSRQGVVHIALLDADVKDPQTMESVPRDGKSLGEIMVRGSTVMKGYFKNEVETQKSFEGGWFHTGDLGVMHADGYIQVKDRSKDIIISGGENISSIEVESIVCGHPQVIEAAVVARPDEHWGETPCAFVTVNEAAVVTAEDIISYCRARLPRYMVPKTVVFGVLPKTATGKVRKFVLKEKAKAMGSLSSRL